MTIMNMMTLMLQLMLVVMKDCFMVVKVVV
jgi:hypothetical protein